MANLKEITTYADKILNIRCTVDYPNALNGLQCKNSGKVSKIACAVDAGLFEIKQAVKMKADLLFVHHGLFWDKKTPFTNLNYEIVKTLIDGNLAVYSCHLPLDANAEFGNNASIAKLLGLQVKQACFECMGIEIGYLCGCGKKSRAQLASSLKKIFPNTLKAFEFGSKNPKSVAICSGGAGDFIGDLKALNCDTFITGELKEHHYIYARDNKINLYSCGHYCSEVFGVQNLAKICAEKFGLEHKFIKTNNTI